jgi:hypothetical protein
VLQYLRCLDLYKIIGITTAQQNDETTNVISAISKICSRIRSMSLEGWKTTFEIIGVILLFFTFIAGAGALIFSNKVNAVKDENLRQFDKDLTDAKTALGKQEEKTAIAEKELANLKDTIRPRQLTKEQQTVLVRLLSGDPKGSVSIMSVMGDGEAKAFAIQVDSALKSAGWTTSGVAQGVFSPNDPVGFGIVVRNATDAPPWAARL